MQNNQIVKNIAPLFEVERTSLSAHIARAEDKLALLPKAVRKLTKVLDDEF